jgi:hypothetical protein
MGIPRPKGSHALRADLVRLMNPEEDSVLLCEVGPVGPGLDSRFEVIGCCRPLTENTALIF